MITALVLTVALGSQPPIEMDYAYGNESACETAKARAIYSTTGNYTVTLECAPGRLVSQPAKLNGEWGIIALGMKENTTEPLYHDIVIETPDEKSCDKMLERMYPRFKALEGRQFVNICLPKA